VKVEFGFVSDAEKSLKNVKSGITFDLMVFEDNADYLCYVEAVHLLMHENIKKNCKFVT